jgi:glutamyl-tRNA reductase
VIVVGLSHRSAPVEIREKLAISAAELPAQLRQLRETTGAGELVLLSTCNRVEIVAATAAADHPSPSLATRIVDAIDRDWPGVRAHLFVYEGRAAIEHLFRVAASLDSLVVGEPQILGQLKDAFLVARDANSVGPWLNRSFERAFRVAKRVRTETALGAGQVSVPTVAVDLASEIFGELAGHNVVLVGTGEMATLVATLLGRAGAKLEVVGRTPEKTRDLAQALGGTAHAWDELPTLLTLADIVISSTSAREHVITLAQVAQARRKRHGRSLFLVDLAVPRDVDPAVGQLDGVFLYNVDDLSRVAGAAVAGRQREAEKAIAIVNAETEAYLQRAHAERITPAVVALRERFRAVLFAEFERGLRGGARPLDEEQRMAMQRMLEACIDKLLHHPPEHLRAWAKDRELGAWHTDLLLAAIEDLFQFRGDAPAAIRDDKLADG